MVVCFARHQNINRVGHLILRALAIQSSSPQNALARISFNSPKSLLPPPSSTPPWSCCSHGRPTYHFAKIFLVLFLSYSFESRAAFGFFAFFSSSTTFGTPEIYFHLWARKHFTFSNLPEEHALIKNNSLATLSSTWYTEGYYFNVNSSLRP